MEKKVKVLHLLQSDRFSGAENVVCQIATITKDIESIEMVYCSKDGPIRESLKKYDLPFISMSKLCLKEVKRVIHEYQPDIIHAHDASASLISALASFKLPIISHLHSNPPWIRKYSLNSILYYMSSFKYKKILTVSDSIMDEYVFGNKLREKVLTISNPIDTQAIIMKAKDKTPNDNVNSYDVAYLGRLASPKNPMRFIKIIKQLKRKTPNISAIMIGEGPLKTECENYIKSLGLENNIKLTGFLENPYLLLSKAKLLCITSNFEGFGLAAIEALTLGLPVVCPAVGGLQNIINDNCGKLCNTDEDFLIEMYNLIMDIDYYNKKSRNALVIAKSLNNVNDYRKQIIHVYNLIGEKG